MFPQNNCPIIYWRKSSKTRSWGGAALSIILNSSMTFSKVSSFLMNVKNIKLFLHVGIGENMLIFLYIKSQRSLFYVHHDNEYLLHNVEDSSSVFKDLLCTFAGSFKFTIGSSRAYDAVVALDPRRPSLTGTPCPGGH